VSETATAAASTSTSTSTSTTVLDEVVHLCVSPDPVTRKFACFAVGNAGVLIVID
jgi:hypothetical protein